MVSYMSRNFAYINHHELIHFSAFHCSSLIIALDFTNLQILSDKRHSFREVFLNGESKFWAGNGLYKPGLVEVIGIDP